MSEEFKTTDQQIKPDHADIEDGRRHEAQTSDMPSTSAGVSVDVADGDGGQIDGSADDADRTKDLDSSDAAILRYMLSVC